MNLIGGHRREIADAEATLDDQLAGGFLTCPLVTVIGAKGGGTKTTTAAALLHLLGRRDRVAGMLLGIDANPDVGDLLERVGINESRVPERLVDFAGAPDAIRHPVDWAPLLDISGRIHLLHNEGVTSSRIEALTADQWRAAITRARRFSSTLVVDTGTGVRHPSTLAAIEAATSLVIATRADPLAIDKSAQSVAELVQDGYADLVSRATVVLTAVDKNVRPEKYGAGMTFLAERVRSVIVVPYDRAVGAVGPIGWNQVRPATRLAWMRALTSVVTDLRDQQAVPLRSEASTLSRIRPEFAWPTLPAAQTEDDVVADALIDGARVDGGWVPDLGEPAVAPTFAAPSWLRRDA